MGNNTNTPNAPEQFRQTCHPGLTDAVWCQDKRMLELTVRARQGYQLWRQDISPLLPCKHLFLPTHVNKHQPTIEQGCCMQEDAFQQPLIYKIYYSSFFYTLDKQILVRRHKNTFFREQELWKLTNSLSKAALEWQQIYPQEKLGIICPSNVVINEQGLIRVVTKLSFLDHSYGSLNHFYTPPENSTNSFLNYALGPKPDPVGTESGMVYSIGTVVLQAATLAMADFEPAGLEEKEVMMRQLGYSPDLKAAILGMMESNHTLRYSLRHLLHLAKENKSRHF